MRIVGLVVVLLGTQRLERHLVDDAADDRAAGPRHLIFGFRQIAPTRAVIADHEQRAIAEAGDLSGVHDQADRRGVNDHLVKLFGERVQKIAEALAGQQWDRVYDITADRNDVSILYVRLVDDLIRGTITRQVVHDAALLAIQLNAVGLDQLGTTQIRVNDDDAPAALGQVLHHLHAHIAFAFTGSTAGEQHFFIFRACKNEVTANLVQRLSTRVIVFPKLGDLRMIHASTPLCPYFLVRAA